MAIARAATTTTVTAPATSKVGATVTFSAAVTAGSYAPTGTVTFQLADGTVLASSAVDAKGVATPAVQMPASETSYRVKARYNADANATASTSDTVTVLVTASGSVVDLTVSAGPYLVGTPLTLTATLTPASATGSVTFSSGSTVIGAERASSGRATLTWRPTAAGALTITASFIPAGETTPIGSDSVQISVVTNLPPNTITVGPVGQAAWAPGQGFALRYRSSVTLATRTASGAPVGLAIAWAVHARRRRHHGHCGRRHLHADLDVAGDLGVLGLAPGQTIALARAQQTATLTPPAPGTLLRKSAYRLAVPGTRTNAGNTVSWRVSYGKSRCKVTYSNDGSVLLRTMKKGRCNVRV